MSASATDLDLTSAPPGGGILSSIFWDRVARYIDTRRSRVFKCAASSAPGSACGRERSRAATGHASIDGFDSRGRHGRGA